MKTAHGNRQLVLFLATLALALGFAAWAEEPAQMILEGDSAAQTTASEDRQGDDAVGTQVLRDLLDPVRLAVRFSEPVPSVGVDDETGLVLAARCNCNLATGTGFCTAVQTCQPCPCFSTQGGFFDGLCK